MKKNLIIVATCSLFISAFLISKVNAQSPTFVWAKAMGGPTTDHGYSIALDDSGNVYTTGNFSGTADFDPGVGIFNLTSTGNHDIFISKLDATGNFVWVKAMGGPGDDFGQSIAIDGSGNVFTTGYFRNTVDFDPGAGTFNLTSPSGGTDIFISKLDASGNFVWAKKLGGPNLDYGWSIALDASSNVYTTGFFRGTADFDPGAGTFNLTSAGWEDIFISKLDAGGNFVWAKTMGGTNFDYGLSMTIDASGNVYTTGQFSDTVDFDPGTGTFNLTATGLSDDIFISKLDAGGNFVWVKAIVGAANDRGHSIAIDGSGNIFTTGYFINTADFDPGAGTFNLTSAGGLDIFILKLDATGNFVWAKAMGSGTYADAGYSIALDASGNVYTTGNFSGTADFDPGVEVFNLTSTGGIYEDIFISKLDAAGNFVWAKAMGSTSFDYGYSIALDASGNIFTTGFFYGTVDFDPGVGTFNLTSAGGGDVFVNKMADCSSPPTPGTISGNATVCSGSSNTYSITAVGGATSYTWVLPGGWTGTSTTNSILTTASSTSGNIYVMANDSCGSSPAQTLAITVNTVDASVSQSVVMLTANATGATYQWINCVGNIPISGETNQSFTAIANGNYAVIVTQTGCTDTSSCFNIANVGIVENSFAPVITIYPNPGSGIFTLSLSMMPSLHTEIRLVNTLGQVIYSGMLQSQTKQFDFSYRYIRLGRKVL